MNKIIILCIALVVASGLVAVARYTANTPKIQQADQTSVSNTAQPTAKTTPSPSSSSVSAPTSLPTPTQAPTIKPQTNSSEVIITEKDNGKTFYANRSDKVTLKLMRQARTWSNLSYDRSIIEFAELEFFAPTDYQQWEGRIKNTGQTTIQLMANRPGSMISTLLFKVTLVVQ